MSVISIQIWKCQVDTRVGHMSTSHWVHSHCVTSVKSLVKFSVGEEGVLL